MSQEALLAAEYVNESHIRAFAEALDADAEFLHERGTTDASATAPPSPVAPTSRIRKVSALSDFAPVNLKVKRRKRKDKASHTHAKGPKHDWSFVLFRWPLLLVIFLFIAGEFSFYVFLRQLVNVKEYISAWRGKKGLLRKKLRGARTYEEWKQAALVLDEYLHFDDWKKEDEDSFYDWKLVRKVHRSLKTLREKNDVRACLGVLETCIRSNFAAVESPRLYSETFLGTKYLIESYFEEQEKALEFIRESPDLKIDEKKRFFKAANTNLGISALCLSGGASFGYYHCGVVKAFLDSGLLPRVITGTSAGGLIAALCCTRTEAELKLLLVPQLANRITACEEFVGIWIQRLWKTGARFDPILWARKCNFFTRGSMTFKEAYLRTGRILNISVIPADRHSPTRLLNYLTAPDTLIWSALLASAAVPSILPPVVLMQKLRDGSAVPWNWGSRFKDGSLRVDVPIQALHTYFNVTHPVVSQVNPHVHLFFFAPRGSAGKPVAHRKGKGWRGNFILSVRQVCVLLYHMKSRCVWAAEQWLKHELTKNFKLIRDLELLPQLLGQDWSSVFLQRFDGNVTIWPRTRFWDWIRILSDPDPAELERMMRVGEMVTWPKLRMIANRAKIEKQIYLGRQHIRKCSRAKSAAENGQPRHGPPRVPPSTTPPPSGSDQPLSVDTDAETAFNIHASRSFFRNKRPQLSPSNSGTSTPNRDHGRHQDPLRSPAARRKWASSLLGPGERNQMIQTSASPLSGSESLFTRLRHRSMSTTAADSPRLEDVAAEAAEDAWSSDSSSEDDLVDVPPHDRGRSENM
ncbi:patatin-domain-containing protein [Mycena belliarum]|uniref:Patatin-like phospholipase domain-containing protein n=1 Tax=Mycena belliarum TaxID=1033014 RepID=A0AAD6XVE7_9AGAR|nr:patatin-domain-containing protein [Mycena belliae]